MVKRGIDLIWVAAHGEGFGAGFPRNAAVVGPAYHLRLASGGR